MVDIGSLERFLSDAVDAGVPGVSVTLISNEGAFSFSAGRLSANEDRPLQTNSPTRLGGVGQLLLAASVIALAEEHRLDLDAPLDKYVQEFEKVNISSFIKLKHLLSHTSGRRGMKLSMQDYADVSADRAVEFFSTTSQLFAPGSVFSLDDLNYALTGLIVERVTGKCVFDVIRETILDPLHLPQSACMPIVVVKGHTLSRDNGCFLEIKEVRPNAFWSAAISEMCMTLPELATFGREIFRNYEADGYFSADFLKVLRQPIVRVPFALSPWEGPGWRPVVEGNGYTYFSNGCAGVISTFNGLSLALAFHTESNTVIAALVNVKSRRIRTQILNAIVACLSGRDPGVISMSPPTYSVSHTFTRFLSGFLPRQLAGLYAGPGGAAIRIEARPDRLRITLEHQEVIIGALQNDRLMIETKSPLSVGVFAAPNGEPALMLGLTAYRRMRDVPGRQLSPKLNGSAA